MSRHPILPEVGRIVEIMRGREAGTFGVVIAHDGDRFVLVADGDRRKVDRPKRKNVIHLRSTPEVAQEIADAASGRGKLTNARVRYALRRYQQAIGMVSEATQEGGVPNGQG